MHEAVSTLGTVRVEFLYIDDCDVAEVMYPRVVEAMGGKAPVERVDQHRIALEDPRRRFHSGTVLIDGKDLFGIAPTPTPILSPS